MRAVCEGDHPGLQLQHIVDPGRAEQRLLGLVEQGLDAGLVWEPQGVRAGADVLHVLHHLLSAPGCGQQQPCAASSAFFTCTSSFMGSVDCRSRPRKLSSVPEEAMEDPEAALAAALRAAANADTAKAQASRDLVVEEGGGRVLVWLLSFTAAQRAALACIAVLAFSVESAVALAQEEGAPDSLAACLESSKPGVQTAALQAVEALGQHLAVQFALAEEEALFAALRNLYDNRLSPASRWAGRILNACEHHKMLIQMAVPCFRNLLGWYMMLQVVSDIAIALCVPLTVVAVASGNRQAFLEDVGSGSAATQLPGISDWKEAAAAYAVPPTYEWDVCVSYAGRADRPFARALKELLERCSWGLRIFLDIASLSPYEDPASALQAALESTHVAVLLLSADFFSRAATRHEMAVLLDRHARHHVILLPVFLRITTGDCKQEMMKLYGEGAHACLPALSMLRCLSARAHRVCCAQAAKSCLLGSATLGSQAFFKKAWEKWNGKRCGTLSTPFLCSCARTLRLVLPAMPCHATFHRCRLDMYRICERSSRHVQVNDQRRRVCSPCYFLSQYSHELMSPLLC